MPIINRIAEFHDDMKAWRRDIHAHPETAFEEFRTAEIVAGKLSSWGIEVHRGLAGTGVVGVLKGRGETGRMIGLRADMDALHMPELNEFEHRSRHENKMHACGHDGHTTMLLGAARYLAETRNFSGTACFIFQPAEENEGGGRVMVADGLFEKFPVDQVYGLHNMPGIAAGTAAMRKGPMMAAFDIFEIVITGKGAHGAMPHQGIDPVVIAAQIITALQTIPSRRTDPIDSVVVSVTQVHAGDTWNVIPEQVTLRGTVRSFKEAVQSQAQQDIEALASNIAAGYGATIQFMYERRYPATVNTSAETEFAAEVAAEIVGEAQVDRNTDPLMGSEDFAYMLQEKPGCYIFLGNGLDGSKGGCSVHNPKYDFNDDISVLGASYWARLVERAMPREA